MKQINTKDEFVRMNMEVYVIDEANIEGECSRNVLHQSLKASSLDVASLPA